MTDETKTRVAGVLKKAIKGEVDGYRFYDALAERTTNPEAKRKLETLRDDEARHKKTLYELFHKLVGGEIGELPEHGIGALAEVFRKGKLEERKTEMEFITLAIEAEMAATNYYKEQRNLIDDPEIQGIFDTLAEEEFSHFEILQAEKDALGGNYYWFSLDEGSPLEY
ncbi:MAG: ferritin family protein [Candidatus Zixiibacteriota bacterium]|jgi:rubrerythrin